MISQVLAGQNMLFSITKRASTRLLTFSHLQKSTCINYEVVLIWEFVSLKTFAQKADQEKLTHFMTQLCGSSGKPPRKAQESLCAILIYRSAHVSNCKILKASTYPHGGLVQACSASRDQANNDASGVRLWLGVITADCPPEQYIWPPWLPRWQSQFQSKK